MPENWIKCEKELQRDAVLFYRGWEQFTFKKFLIPKIKKFLTRFFRILA